MRHLSGPSLIVAMCLAEIIGMASFAMFPALMPGFISEWALTNTEAGWINGMYFAGYTVAVPVLVSMTDRVDPRRIYLASATVTAVSAFGFAFLANGFWSALILRTLAGIGLAGTYMPGLKALSDQLEGTAQSRAVAVYTASFGIGASVSFAISGEIAHWLDWQGAFAVGGICAGLALFIIAAVLAPVPVKHIEPERHLLDFRPVLRNRPAIGYVLAYTAHNWELFGLRSWVVAFLVYAQSLQSDDASWWSPPLIAAAVNLIGWPASVLGNELAVRFGRQRLVILVMTASAIYACGFGFTASLPFVVIVALSLFYGIHDHRRFRLDYCGCCRNRPSGSSRRDHGRPLVHRVCRGKCRPHRVRGCPRRSGRRIEFSSLGTGVRDDGSWAPRWDRWPSRSCRARGAGARSGPLSDQT